MADTAAALHPALRLSPSRPGGRVRVLFLCTGNSARSPIAAALLRRELQGRGDVTSAGSRPQAELHPAAVRVLREEFGIGVAGQRPQHVDAVAGRPFDVVVTLCDRVREVCPEFPGRSRRVHWSLPDPAADGGDRAAFRAVATEIARRVGHLVPTLSPAAPEEVRS